MITLSETKTFLQITETTYDGLLNQYIDLITSSLSAYLDNPIVLKTVTNKPLNSFSYYYADNATIFTLEGYPIRNVTVFKDATALTEKTDYDVDIQTGELTLYATDDLDNYTITYTIGYNVADVPKELKFVALSAIKKLFEANGKSTPGANNISAKKIGDYQVSYNTNKETNEIYSIIQNVLTENKEILSKYKRLKL